MMSGEDMKLGLVVWGDRDPRADVRRWAAQGVESFQIIFRHTLGGIDLTRLADEVNEAIDGTGAVVSSLGIFGNTLETDELAEETRKGWKECIKHVHSFGADLVCGFPGRLRAKPIPDSLSEYKRIFEPLVATAGESNVRIAFENCVQRGTWLLGGDNIAMNPDAWKLMFETLDAPNLGLEWEPAHPICQMMDPLPQLKEWAHKIFHIHGKDGRRHMDIISSRGIFASDFAVTHHLPGFGETDWREIVSILRESGYGGSIDIEGGHDPDWKGDREEEGLCRALDYLKECRRGS